MSEHLPVVILLNIVGSLQLAFFFFFLLSYLACGYVTMLASGAIFDLCIWPAQREATARDELSIVYSHTVEELSALKAAHTPHVQLHLSFCMYTSVWKFCREKFRWREFWRALFCFSDQNCEGVEDYCDYCCSVGIQLQAFRLVLICVTPCEHV